MCQRKPLRPHWPDIDLYTRQLIGRIRDIVFCFKLIAPADANKKENVVASRTNKNLTKKGQLLQVAPFSFGFLTKKLNYCATGAATGT